MVAYCLLCFRLGAVALGKGSNWRIGASTAAGIHFRSVMVLVARSKACCRTAWSGAERLREPTEKQPEVPHVIVAGLGRGLAATASTDVANRVEAVATDARRRSRMAEM